MCIKDKKDIAILEAALQVFSHRGLAGATYDHIAKASGVSRLTIVRRYPEKEGLFHAVLEHYRDEAAPETFTASGEVPVSPEEALVECFRLLFQRIHLVRLIQNESVRMGNNILSDWPFYESLLSQLTEVLSQDNMGAPRQRSEQTADFLLSSVWSLVLEWNLKFSLWEPDKQAINDALEHSRKWLGVLGYLR